MVNKQLFILPEIPKMHPGSNEYIEWWREMKRRCIEGYWIGGIWCPGNLYFYINFWTILLNKSEHSKTKTPGRPILRDLEWEFFYNWVQARGLSGFSQQPKADSIRDLLRTPGVDLGRPIFENEARNLMMMGSRGFGKDLIFNTLVHTSTGTKQIDKVVVGDRIYGADGKLTTILNINKYYNLEQFEVTLADGRKVICGDGHLWGVIDNTGKYKVLELRDIRKNYLAKPRKSGKLDSRYFIPMCLPLGYSMKELPIKPYLLGSLIGDGGLTSGRVTFTTADIESLEYIKIDLPNGTKLVKVPSTKYGYSIIGTSYIKQHKYNPLTSSLKELGLMGHTRDKFIPKEYLLASIEQRLELLRGLMDTDGSIIKEGNCEFSTISKQLSKDFEVLCRSLGIRVKTNTKTSHYYKEGIRVECSLVYRTKIITSLPIFKLTRKLSRLNNNPSKYAKANREKVAITNIRSIGIYPSVCIAVDNVSKLFLVNDFVTTHNSFGVAGGVIAHEFLFDGLKQYDADTIATLSSTEIVVGAGDAKYSSDLLKKVDFGFTQLPGGVEVNGRFYPCPFSKQVTGSWTSGKEVIAQYKKKQGGTWKWLGSMSKIKHRTFKDNEFAANGTRPAVMVMEEIGMFDNLKASHESSVECMKNGTYKFGSCMYLGTGGDMEGGTQDAHEMFYDPDTFDMLDFLDEWENRGKIGYFVPASKGLNQFKDENGITDDEKAIKYLEEFREKLRQGKNAHSAMDAELQNRPIKPSEMFLRKTGNIFPRVELSEWLAKLETTGKYRDAAMIGELYLDDSGKTKWRPNDKLRPIERFPLKKDDDKEGCVVIWEHPYLDHNGNTPFGLYIAGCDPIDQDEAYSSPSLNSTFVYKTFISANTTYNIPVAEFTGRPGRADESYEITRRLLMYYNAKCLYENQLKGLKSYFETKRSLHLLKEQPGIISDIVKDSKVKRGYGIHMTTQIKAQCEIYLRDWLIEKKEDDSESMNMHEIYSIPLLKELIAYNRDDNFDRVISFMLCILHQIDNHKVKVEQTKPTVMADKFFSTDIFAKKSYSY